MPERDELALFASTNYKTYVGVGLRLHGMTQVECSTDTRAGLNQVSKSFLHSTQTMRFKCRNFLEHGRASKESISLERAILIWLQIGGLRIHVWFKVEG